jgi:flagellar biosynthesis protein FlhA
MGYALLSLVNGPGGQDRLTEQIKALRRQLAAELGFVMPSVRILDNVQLDANTYVVRVKEIEAGTGQIFPGQFMAMDPMGGQVQLPGQHLLEPTFGLPATWIDASLRDQAQIRGYTVVDAATVVSTHLTEVIKAHVSELLNHVEVQKLLKELSKEHGDLIKEVVPSQIATTGIQRVVRPGPLP